MLGTKKLRLKWKPNCFVYVIGMDGLDDLYKVGCAKNINKRVSNMQSANPLKLVVLRRYGLPSRSLAFFAENKMHTLLDEMRFRGEWFKTNLDTIDEAAKTVIGAYRHD